MTALNIWHFIVIIVTLVSLVLGIYKALTQPSQKLKIPMLISVILITALIGGFAFIVVDRYTKIVSLHKLDSKRLLSIEKVVYTGTVRNDGNYKIGEVTLEIKLVNKGHATGNVKAGSFYQASGFFDFFSGGAGVLYKPQTIVNTFVVAKNIKPGAAKAFRVHFAYPPYFKSVSHFTEVYGH